MQRPKSRVQSVRPLVPETAKTRPWFVPKKSAPPEITGGNSIRLLA